MEAGKIEMSQMYTTWLAEKYEQDFLAFDLPFLFKDHDHAARVFEGPIGKKMLDGYNLQGSKVQGLAFTYSGGYKQIGLNKRESKEMVDAIFDLITEKLVQGEEVKISGFGNFQIRTKAARPGRNPRTGEVVAIDARRVVTFHASQKLKEQIQSGIDGAVL